MTENKKDLRSEKNAVYYCLEELHKTGFRWSNVTYINQGRYCIVEGFNKNIAIIFKKEWFLSFGDMKFKSEAGYEETGIGDSINVEDLKTMIANNIENIYIVYKDGKIYYIALHDFLLYSHPWTNKEAKYVRSISIHRYRRFGDE